MAFNNGFNGDFVSLGYILQTLAKKTILIEGVTCAQGLSVSAMGEVATFYKRAATSVTAGANLGDQLTYVAKGVTLVQIPMTSCIAIQDVLAQASFATVAADVVGDRVLFNSISAANALNAAALAVLENAGPGSSQTPGTIVTGYTLILSAAQLGGLANYYTPLVKTTVYSAIVNAKSTFITVNKAKGLVPTALIVSPFVYGLLNQASEILHTFGTQADITSNGVVGELLGMKVILGIDLAATTDFIIMNAEGFAAPVNVKSLVVFDATPVGYPNGTGIAGEIGYGFKMTEDNLVMIKINTVLAGE